MRSAGFGDLRWYAPGEVPGLGQQVLVATAS
jgi:hypothetical protein